MSIDQRRAILRLAGPDISQNLHEVSASQASVAGRLASCDITLKHTKVSREHARFEVGPKGLTVQDLGSSNGTFIGDSRIDPNVPVLLNVGDTIRIGPFTLLFEQIVEVGQKPLDMELPSVMLNIADGDDIASQVSQEMATPGFTPIGIAPSSQSPSFPVANVPATSPASPGFVGPLVPVQRSLPAISSPADHMIGISQKASSLLQYLPGVYSDDEFTGRFLLIFEAIHAPLEWIVDCFYCYLDTNLAPPEWLQWFASWVSVIIPSALPEKKQRQIAAEIGSLFLTRGTKGSLARHLELVFDVKADIDEPKSRPNTFTVALTLGKDQNTDANREIANRIIESHCPIHARYELKIT